MKNLFKTPELEIVFLRVDDVVYTSGILGENPDFGNADGSLEDMT